MQITFQIMVQETNPEMHEAISCLMYFWYVWSLGPQLPFFSHTKLNQTTNQNSYPANFFHDLVLVFNIIFYSLFLYFKRLNKYLNLKLS